MPAIPPFFLDPARHMPDGPANLPPGVCRGCGCTDDHACPGGCWWTDGARTICSCCAGLKPTRGADGRQLAPETFARWEAPGVWLDTDGARHFDVARLLAVFDAPDTPAIRRELTGAMEDAFAAHLPRGSFRVRR